MSKIKPVYQSQTGGVWHDVTDKEYAFRRELSGVYQTRILYPAAAYEALQKENERLKVDLYGMQEAKKARFNISKANQEEAHKLLNEACDDNAMKQQTIISLKYEIDGMHDLNAAQAKRIEEQQEDNLKQKDLILNFQTQYAKDHAEIESLRKQVDILQRPLDDEIISRIICLVKNIPDEELASNVFESVRNMTNWNKSTPSEFLILFDQKSASKNGE